MNKRVTIDIPEEMHRLIVKHAAEAGTQPDAYVLELIEHHLEDLHDLAAAEAALERIRKGESRVISAEEFWRGLDD